MVGCTLMCAANYQFSHQIFVSLLKAFRPSGTMAVLYPWRLGVDYTIEQKE